MLIISRLNHTLCIVLYYRKMHTNRTSVINASGIYATTTMWIWTCTVIWSILPHTSLGTWPLWVFWFVTFWHTEFSSHRCTSSSPQDGGKTKWDYCNLCNSRSDLTIGPAGYLRDARSRFDGQPACHVTSDFSVVFLHTVSSIVSRYFQIQRDETR